MEKHVTIDTAGTALRVTSPDEGLLDALADVYSPFLDDGSPGLRLSVEVRGRPDPGLLDGRGIRHTVNLDGRLYLRDAGFSGEVRLDEGTGELQVAAGRAVEAFGLAYRHIFTRVAVDRGWTFIHASGVVRDGRAYVFSGPSGAGKTTIAGMLEGVRIIHDDLLFLGAMEDVPAIIAVPYMGEDRFIHDRTGAWPVEAVYFLSKDTRPFIEPVATGVAAGRLLAAPLEWLGDPSAALMEYLGRSLDRCTALVQGTRCGELHFSLAELPRELTVAWKTGRRIG